MADANGAGRPRLAIALRKCAADRAGVTAIEYALIAGIIVIAITALIQGIGNSLNGMLNSVTTGL